MSVQTQKSGFSQYIHYIITAIIIFGFRFLPNFGPVTDDGMVLLGVFIGAVYGWSFINMLWPSILPKTWILPIFLNKLTVFGHVAVFMVVMYMKRLNYLLDLPSVISADEAEKLQKEAAALKSEAGINDFRRLLLRMNCVIKKTLPMIGGVFVLIRRKDLF